MSVSPDRQAALDLVDAIRQDDVAAWHRFIDEYGGLVHAVTRRYLPFASWDERRDVFVEILRKLRDGALARYDGRAGLSTWLYIFSRSRCIDRLRTSRGRLSRPASWKTFSRLDRRVYQLHFVEGLGRAEMARLLRVTPEELAESLERLDEALDERTRRHMAYDLFARSIGAVSGRLLEFLHELRIENEVRLEDSGPDHQLFQADAARAIDQVRAYIDRLPELERKVIDLRFYQGRTARETSAELALGGQREVYSVENRAIRALRGMFGR